MRSTYGIIVSTKEKELTTMTTKHDLALTHDQHQAIATVYNIVRKLVGEEDNLVSVTTCRSISMDDIFTTLDILEAIQENNKWAVGK